VKFGNIDWSFVVSRIGKKVITIPKGVSITRKDNLLTVKGTKGELSYGVQSGISVDITASEVTFTRASDVKEMRALHGLSRALTQNMITGVSEGYSKQLDIVGVGYRAEAKNENLLLTVGYSHPIYFMPPAGITITTPTPTQIIISGIDKQLVGQIAAKIRSFRKPEPYKGKGIKYSTEVIRKKAGKTAGK
jgi:large subunit ribosomal protein L6